MQIGNVTLVAFTTALSEAKLGPNNYFKIDLSYYGLVWPKSYFFLVILPQFLKQTN